MADDVKWIRFKVGTFDGVSFKRIKRAKIDGVVNLRDKLTAVWFELLDLGGKVNNQGLLVNNDLAFKSYEDIAIVLDRTTEEVEMCIKWFINESMMDVTDDILMISNWNKYQNVEGLDKIRLQNAERQKKFRESKKQLALEYKDNVDSNVTVTLRNAKPLIDNNSISSSDSQSSSLTEKDSKEKQDNLDNNPKDKPSVIHSYFDNLELNTLFNEFLALRIKLKAKNTERAITLLLNELNQYDNETKIEMINNSILNSWKGVFPLKGKEKTKTLKDRW
jgi:hypothetical protein